MDGRIDDSARLGMTGPGRGWRRLRRPPRREGNPNCDLSHLNGCRATGAVPLPPCLVTNVCSDFRETRVALRESGVGHLAGRSAGTRNLSPNEGIHGMMQPPPGRSRMPGNVLAHSSPPPSSCAIVVQVFLWCPQRESEISLSQRGRELPIHNDRRGKGGGGAGGGRKMGLS